MKKYLSIGDTVLTKIHYKNDRRTEIEAIICGINIDGINGNVSYKISFEPDNIRKKQGSTGCIGYVSQNDIIKIIK